MSVASSTVPGMDPKIVAGERVDVLLAALRQMKCRKTRDGWVRISATLDRELGEPSAERSHGSSESCSTRTGVAAVLIRVPQENAEPMPWSSSLFALLRR